MFCGTAVMVNGRGGLEVSLEPIPQCPNLFSYVGFRTVDVGALEMIDDPTFVKFGILVHGGYQYCSESVGALEMYLYAFGLANLFELFSCTLYVRDHGGDVPIFVFGVVVICRVAVVAVVLVRLVVSVELVLKLI